MRLKVKSNPAKSYIAEFLEKLRDRFWFRVLVIEDSATSRNLLRLAMDTLPCTIDYAEDGKEARKFLEGVKGYDLVIVDQDLPDTHGLRILEAIDKQKSWSEGPRRSAIPFLVYSGIDLKPVAEMTRFRFMGFIRKPTNLPAIHDRIERVLKQYRPMGA